MSSLDKHEDHYKQAPLALQGRLVEYSWVVHDNVWELFQWLSWFGKDLVQLSCSMMGVRSPVGIQVYGAKDSKYDLDRIGFILDLFLKPFQIMIILNSTKFIWRKDGIEKEQFLNIVWAFYLYYFALYRATDYSQRMRLQRQNIVLV